MPTRKRYVALKLGERARSKVNQRVGTVDAVDGDRQHRLYGLHYDEAPQDRYLAHADHDGAQLPPELIERA
jgi:hypothetical protein